MAITNVPDCFPAYLMKVGDEFKFLTMPRAGVIFDSGYEKVEIVGYVLNEDFTVRKITEKEQDEIAERALDYSASK